MIPVQRKDEIVRAFQVSFKRDNTEGIAAFTLGELRDTDAMLANRDLNAGFRTALRNRIKAIEDQQAQTKESYIRAMGYIVSFCIGVLATLVAVWLT
jgi:hypothetical protein